ncbi:MAG: iron ABC transporter permease [Eubacteriales bacterium]|nr:iron ABC transporter permease [Eubacteriales bacterium]
MIALFFTGGILLISLFWGRYPLPWLAIFNGFQDRPLEKAIFFNLRLPRVLLAAYAGFVLALVGSVLQTIFKNPLASPDVMGVSSGASVGAAFAILFLGGSMFTVTTSAFVGGLLAVALAVLLAHHSNTRQLATFVVTGLAVNALAQSILMILKKIADPQNTLAAIEFWTMGGLGNTTMGRTIGTIATTLPPLVLLIVLNRQITLLSLSDTEAAALGVNLKWVRPGLLALSTLAIAGIVSGTGLISFIGLIAPHIARLITRRNTLAVWLLSGTIGASLLLVADLLARTLTTSEIPVSILTSLIGVPILIAILLRGGKMP